MRTLSKAAKAIAAIALLGMLVSGLLGPVTALGRVIGKGILHAVLDDVKDSLDQQKIDVVAGSPKDVPTTARPRVAEMTGIPLPPPDTKVQQWMFEFAQGASGFVAAVPSKAGGRRAESSDAFLKEWVQAPAGTRVFLSFTSTDVADAEKVAEAFRARGYTTFVYLNRAQPAPRYPAEVAGMMFQQADYRFVLDTPSARKSLGVTFEALLALPAPSPAPPPSPPDPPNAPSSAAAFAASIGSLWVTMNPFQPDRLYVHTDKSMAVPLYVIFPQADGSWRVHDVNRYGYESRPSMTVSNPPNVEVGLCTCDFPEASQTMRRNGVRR
jgi:hypothetical protein